jgi:hypothetical protein
MQHLGKQKRAFMKTLSLTTHTYAQGLPELWQVLQASITVWHGQACWQTFAARHQSAFMASVAQTGLQIRDCCPPSSYPQCRKPPASLLPMLAGFELPALHYQQQPQALEMLLHAPEHPFIAPSLTRQLQAQDEL